MLLQRHRLKRRAAVWVTVNVEGGWLSYHRESGQLDPHCEAHEACTVNRRMRKGPTGLALLWLRRGKDTDRVKHIVFKSGISAEDQFEGRRAQRRFFQDRSQDDPVIAGRRRRRAAGPGMPSHHE